MTTSASDRRRGSNSQAQPPPDEGPGGPLNPAGAQRPTWSEPKTVHVTCKRWTVLRNGPLATECVGLKSRIRLRPSDRTVFTGEQYPFSRNGPGARVEALGNPFAPAEQRKTSVPVPFYLFAFFRLSLERSFAQRHETRFLFQSRTIAFFRFPRGVCPPCCSGLLLA